MKEIAAASAWKKKDPHTATDCISQRPSQLAACNALILHRKLADRANRNGPGIALTLGRALRVFCVLPLGSRTDSVPNSGRINRISSNRHFAVANC